MNSTPVSPVLTVLIPVYNEAEILSLFAPSLIELCRTKDWKIIFVNDGSCDDTKRILDGLDSSFHLRVIHHKVNRGYGGALKTGISQVTTPFLVTMDGDGQHRPEDVE